MHPTNVSRGVLAQVAGEGSAQRAERAVSEGGPTLGGSSNRSRFKAGPVCTEQVSSAMLAELLRQEVMSVEMRVNGREALGLLRVGPESQLFVTCICFMDGGECPTSTQVLSEQEIATLKRKGQNHFASGLLVLSNNPPAGQQLT